ncbi:MAG TPA: alpha-E domain-containing protein, partial [Gemmataceae bacterium]|nr:alpha-E domain-containing protein [Gemmataceae bacterium]
VHDYKGVTESEEVQRFMTWEADNPCSIITSITSARENARIIREVVSHEYWERINFFYLWMQGDASHILYERDRNEFYGQVRRINQLLFGVGEGTMSHGEPWEFFLLGKYLERSCQTARILDVKYHLLLPTPDLVGTPIDNAHWMAILKSCSGYEPFHKQRAGFEHGTQVADFLIFELIFPRSVRSCLMECREACRRIRRKGDDRNELERQLDDMIDWLNLVGIDDLVAAGLHESLTRVVNAIHEMGSAVYRDYFEIPVERLAEMLTPTGSKQSQMQTSA